MTHHDRRWTITLLSFAASLLLTPYCFAQAPTLSRMEGRYAISVERCLRQATRAFESRGYRVTDVYEANHLVYGIHGTEVAAIACNEAPGGTTWVNVVVASLTLGGDVTQRDSKSLRDEMERLARERWDRDRR